ncbi:MAG: hypothetical protein AB7V13_10000 [Pseudorhodoplanes sp.]|uniref:hypothetical protein n=1 Tax=Pseudorhodoplanes sp. TaxID=1934341 RepID=UPI003D10B1F4
MKLSEYSAVYQANDAIDAASLEGYAAMIKGLNGLIMKAANDRLAIDDEPADYERLILRPKP